MTDWSQMDEETLGAHLIRVTEDLLKRVKDGVACTVYENPATGERRIGTSDSLALARSRALRWSQQDELVCHIVARDRGYLVAYRGTERNSDTQSGWSLIRGALARPLGERQLPRVYRVDPLFRSRLSGLAV
jgi:hypothetical protein